MLVTAVWHLARQELLFGALTFDQGSYQHSEVTSTRSAETFAEPSRLPI